MTKFFLEIPEDLIKWEDLKDWNIIFVQRASKTDNLHRSQLMTQDEFLEEQFIAIYKKKKDGEGQSSNTSLKIFYLKSFDKPIIDITDDCFESLMTVFVNR